ncbi:uroporphyrinogen-III synthase HemD family protein [Lysobacter capsici]|nr:uroporphyrinogen-III synthase HemD family protein [Lysobacter capsici]
MSTHRAVGDASTRAIATARDRSRLHAMRTLCEADRMSRTPRQPPRWYVISLRPSDEHEALRAIAKRYGGALIELSPWSVHTHNNATTRRALADALDATHIVVTSPNAAHALHDLHAADQRSDAPLMRSTLRRMDQHWYAVGASTAARLRAIGIDEVASPERMTSEGLLDLPSLQRLHGSSVGLITAPGGRGVLAPAFEARGARVLRADIYRREPSILSRFAIAQLIGLDAPAVLALSSGEALQQVLAQLPDDAAARLRGVHVSAASERLAELARSLGFAEVAVAAGPRPEDLLDPDVLALLPGATLTESEPRASSKDD